MKYQEQRLYEILKDQKKTKITNEELASKLRVSTKTVSDCLKNLEDKKLISRQRFFEDKKNVRVIEVLK